MPSDPLFLAPIALLAIAVVYLLARRGPGSEDAASTPTDQVAKTEPDVARTDDATVTVTSDRESGAKKVAAVANDVVKDPPSSAKLGVEGPLSAPSLPKIDYVEDADVDPTLVGVDDKALRASYAPPTQKIVYDDDAADDEPTQPGALILVTATGQTDKGLRRKRNEDSLLAREDEGIFVVADGMGGYRGGEIASHLAVETIERAFETKSFPGPAHDTIPPRASELARAIQMANQAIFDKANNDKQLEGMGTTICAARFSKNKQRLYVGHVGDSRLYRMRDGRLRQMTSDHTMAQLGVNGEGAGHLSRAVGVWPIVPVDIVLGKPHPGDIYLLCSDGLSKMVSDEDIEKVLREAESPARAVELLINAANEHGGKDNVTVIVIRVDTPFKALRPHAA